MFSLAGVRHALKVDIAEAASQAFGINLRQHMTP